MGKPMTPAALVRRIIEIVKRVFIKRLAVEVLTIVIALLERALAAIGAKEEGRELLRLLTEPKGQEVLEEVVEAFV